MSEIYSLCSQIELAPMDGSIEATNHAFSEQIDSVNVNDSMSLVSNEHDAANVKNNTNDRLTTDINSKPRYVFLLFLYQT